MSDISISAYSNTNQDKDCTQINKAIPKRNGRKRNNCTTNNIPNYNLVVIIIGVFLLGIYIGRMFTLLIGH